MKMLSDIFGYTSEIGGTPRGVRVADLTWTMKKWPIRKGKEKEIVELVTRLEDLFDWSE